MKSNSNGSAPASILRCTKRQPGARLVLLQGLLLLGMGLPALAPAEAERVVPLAWVGGDIGDGARLGLEEARLQGRFAGLDYTLEPAPAASAPGSSRPMAILAAVHEADELLALAQAWPDTPVFNLRLDGDRLREACVGNLLHVPPSRRMRRDALAQWLEAHPQQEPGAESRAWHPAFLKYAARDLNKRFRKTAQRPMTDEDWAGWAAMRMTADIMAKHRYATAAELLDHLRNRLAFDGQKGVPLSFRPTGQLRQPLLLARGEELLGEAPVRGARLPPGVDDPLDSLGLAHCPK